MNIVDKKEIKVGDIVVNNVGNTFEVIEGFKLKDMDMVIDPKEELPLYDVVGNINDTPYLLKKKLTDVHNVLQNTPYYLPTQKRENISFITASDAFSPVRTSSSSIAVSTVTLTASSV